MSHNLSTLEGRGMKVFTVSVAMALSLCLAATAMPSDHLLPPRGPQGLPGPGPTEVAPSHKVPPPRGPQGLPGPGPTAPPRAGSPEAVLSPASSLTSAMKTLAPEPASRRAVAAPRPDPPPVMKNVPFSTCKVLSSLFSGVV